MITVLLCKLSGIRKSHEAERQCKKQLSKEVSKERRIIKKRLKDSDNYVLEQGM